MVFANVDGLMDHATEFAQRCFTDKGEVLSMFIAVTPAHKIHVYATPWDSDDSKVVILKMLRQEFRHHHIVRYAHISEVWLAQEHKDPRLRSGLMPSQRSDREEAVSILAVDRDGSVRHALYPIIRDLNGTRLGERREDMTWAGGRITELLQ
jgi:hypothetical protein